MVFINRTTDSQVEPDKYKYMNHTHKLKQGWKNQPLTGRTRGQVEPDNHTHSLYARGGK